MPRLERGYVQMALTPIVEIVQRIKGEYLEMPGLCLTPAQAQRLWGLDQPACDAVFGVLVDLKFLARTGDGAFVRAGSPLRPRTELTVPVALHTTLDEWKREQRTLTNGSATRDQ